MLVSVRLNNCYIYDQEVEFSMRADMRQKRFSSNVVSGKNSNVVKTAMIIGPNNAGKTNLCRCIAGIKGILLNQGIGLGKNLFSPNAITEFEIVFIEKENEYSFTVKIDLSRSEFLYENLTQILYDKYKNKKETVMYIRDNISSEYVCADEKLSSLMRAMGRNNLLFYLLESPYLYQA